MSDKLKPCPFCGANNSGIAVATDFNDTVGELAYVECLSCNARTGRATGKRNKEFVISKWNTRDDDKRIAELEAELFDAYKELLIVKSNHYRAEDIDRSKITESIKKKGYTVKYYQNSDNESEMFILPQHYDSTFGNEIWSEVDGHIHFGDLE